MLKTVLMVPAVSRMKTRIMQLMIMMQETMVIMMKHMMILLMNIISSTHVVLTVTPSYASFILLSRNSDGLSVVLNSCFLMVYESSLSKMICWLVANAVVFFFFCNAYSYGYFVVNHYQ